MGCGAVWLRWFASLKAGGALGRVVTQRYGDGACSMMVAASPLLTGLDEVNPVEGDIAGGMTGMAVFEFLLRRRPPVRRFILAGLAFDLARARAAASLDPLAGPLRPPADRRIAAAGHG